MDLEERVANLEELLNAFISSQSKKDTYNEYDKAGMRNIEGKQETEISDARSAIEELYEMITGE